jgi:hypothetical protein
MMGKRPHTTPQATLHASLRGVVPWRRSAMMGRTIRRSKKDGTVMEMLPPCEDCGSWLILAKAKQLQKNVAGHGDVPKGHDQNKPERPGPKSALPEAHPYKKGQKSKVRVKERGARPWTATPAEFAGRQEQRLVGLYVRCHGDHPNEDGGEQNFQERFHGSFLLDRKSEMKKDWRVSKALLL